MSGHEQDGAALPPEFDSFYSKAYASVAAYARFLAVDIADAEQAVTIGFTAAARRWAVVGGYEAPDQYVRKIVRQEVVRMNGRWRVRRDAERRGSVAPPSSDPELSAEVREVLALTRGLPRKQREVLALHCLEYTSKEIALELGIGPSTVRTHLERARSRLRDALGIGTEDDRATEFVSAGPARDQLTGILLRSAAELREAFAAETGRMERIRARIIARLASQMGDGR